RRPRGNAHGTEAGAVADAPPLLRDDELYRESDRHAPARHAEHQTLRRWRHAPAVDRARPAARRGAFPVHQAPWRARRARDGPRHRHVRGARRVSPRGHRRRKRAATIGSGSIFSPGAAMSVIPRAAVNGRYDGLPPHSAKFNSERDNPALDGGSGIYGGLQTIRSTALASSCRSKRSPRIRICGRTASNLKPLISRFFRVHATAVGFRSIPYTRSMLSSNEARRVHSRPLPTPTSRDAVGAFPLSIQSASNSVMITVSIVGPKTSSYCRSTCTRTPRWKTSLLGDSAESLSRLR